MKKVVLALWWVSGWMFGLAIHFLLTKHFAYALTDVFVSAVLFFQARIVSRYDDML